MMSCYSCRLFAELKLPKVQKDKDGVEYTIYGYCFKKKYEKPYNDGYPVFLADGSCKDYKGYKRREQTDGQLSFDFTERREG